VARLRGDEFAILLDGLAELEDATAVGDRVLVDLLASFSVGGDEVFISPSIGIAVSATGYTQAEAAVRDADTALYRARLMGRARCEVFDTAIVRSAQTEVQLQADFKQALARREFFLDFQPVVSLATDRIAGFEALVRWRHPIRGLISPAEFISIAEQTGFIVPLGQWSLREACLQLKAWHETVPAAKDVWVSVNISAPQFNQPSLVADIAEALRDVGLPAHCLVVELTEGVAMENPAAVKGLLMQLRMMGVRVALDDFGTGQSSLAYLHQFPADKLKLDRSFICDMESRRDVRDIVGAVGALAHQLGLEVIAEGVETEGQLALVRSLDCEYVQGFIFSRPVDAERAAELLRSGFAAQPEPRPEEAPAPDATSEQGLAAAAASGRRSRISKVMYVSAAAVATLALAGLVARFAFQPPAPAPASAKPPAADAPGVPVTQDLSTANAAAPKAVRPAAKPLVYSVPVVHKHALRGCRGQLTVSQRGLDFVPEQDEDKKNDAFSFKYSEFQHSFSGGELTVQSKTRTYRFKAADATGADGGRARLQEIADRITRLSRTASAK
jgi:EAL domain-containing protein (putative c-di-GMP-specific phosphodiesterase class I)